MRKAARALLWLSIFQISIAFELDTLTKTDEGISVAFTSVPGFSRWSGPSNLFTSSQIVVECGGRKEFAVFVEGSVDGLRAAVDRRDKAWCGWAHALGHDPTRCVVPVSPFGATYIAVRDGVRGGLPSLIKGRDSLAALGVQDCTIQRQDQLSLPKMIGAVAGALLFWWAPQLALSTPFRLTSGTVGFVLLSLLFFVFMVYRAFPHKKRIAVLAGVLGTSFWASVRYMCGSWLPSMHQLLRNPLVLAYLVVSAITGLIITYWFNDSSNHKVNTILRVGLQVTGLALLAGAASLPEGSVFLVSLPLLLRFAQKCVGLVRQKRRDALDKKNDGASTPVKEAGEKLVSQTPETASPALERDREAPQDQPLGFPATPTAAWLIEGKVLNVETGHLIGVGKGTYNRLIEEGYILDEQRGTLTPPPSSARKKITRSGGAARRRRS